MRNRYQRDLNRLVKHPRRAQDARKLRTPGALNGSFSAAAGLPREPVQTDPDIFVNVIDSFTNSFQILRMSPDIRTVKETVWSRNDAFSFAVYDGNFVFCMSASNAESETRFSSTGLDLYTGTNDLQRVMAGVNSQHFLIRLIDVPNEKTYIERFDHQGVYQDRIEITADIYPTAFNSAGIPANDEFCYITGAQSLQGENGFLKIPLDGGAQTYQVLYNPGAGNFATSNRLYISNITGARIEIFDEQAVFIKSLDLSGYPLISKPNAVCVTQNKMYVSAGRVSDEVRAIGIFSKSGDDFTFIEIVDFGALHGFTDEDVDFMTPDMKLFF